MFVVLVFEVGVLVGVNLVEHHLHVCRLRHASHEEQACYYQSHFYRDGQVEDDGQQECYYKYGYVALRILQKRHERTPSAHAVCHHHEHSGKACHRYVSCQRHKEKEYEQQHHSVYYSGYRRLSSVVDVGHGACYGSRCRYASEKWRYEVGYSLTHKFGVGVVTVARHTVCYRSREQALYGSEYGDGECRRHESLHCRPRHFRQLRVGKP